MSVNTGSRKNNPDWEESRSASGRKSWRKKSRGGDKNIGELRNSSIQDEFQYEDPYDDHIDAGESYIDALPENERAAEQRTYSMIEDYFNNPDVDENIKDQFYDNYHNKGMGAWEAIDKIDYKQEVTESVKNNGNFGEVRTITTTYEGHPFNKRELNAKYTNSNAGDLYQDTVEMTIGDFTVSGELVRTDDSVTKVDKRSLNLMEWKATDSSARGMSSPRIDINKNHVAQDDERLFDVVPGWSSSNGSDTAFDAMNQIESIYKTAKMAEQVQGLVDYEVNKIRNRSA